MKPCIAILKRWTIQRIDACCQHWIDPCPGHYHDARDSRSMERVNEKLKRCQLSSPDVRPVNGHAGDIPRFVTCWIRSIGWSQGIDGAAIIHGNPFESLDIIPLDVHVADRCSVVQHRDGFQRLSELFTNAVDALDIIGIQLQCHYWWCRVTNGVQEVLDALDTFTVKNHFFQLLERGKARWEFIHEPRVVIIRSRI